MKRSNLLIGLASMVGALMFLVLLSQPFHAQDDEVLLLQRKISELEGRIKQLESLLEECVGAQKKGTTREFGWQNKKNWRKLEIGMSEVEVRSILGEPTKIIKGVKTLWYYPNIYGGFVSFGRNGKLAGWNEP
ncbi:MAG: hypothetical protein JSW15_05895 [Deltaproteobacteria bacterium]|nr:MAG: hypothetical protein JSW15_05895 [Deltaproteobacteria bacterium]